MRIFLGFIGKANIASGRGLRDIESLQIRKNLEVCPIDFNRPLVVHQRNALLAVIRKADFQPLQTAQFPLERNRLDARIILFRNRCGILLEGFRKEPGQHRIVKARLVLRRDRLLHLSPHAKNAGQEQHEKHRKQNKSKQGKKEALLLRLAFFDVSERDIDIDGFIFFLDVERRPARRADAFSALFDQNTVPAMRASDFCRVHFPLPLLDECNSLILQDTDVLNRVFRIDQATERREAREQRDILNAIVCDIEELKRGEPLRELEIREIAVQ